MLKRNNKGFTLVEVIAVVAILGILSVLVVPRIFSLVTDSRKDIYVEDAKRLIAQARYTMNANSVNIEKPEDGECILFSMRYLSISDFQNAPNGGSYIPDASFVLVRNVDEEYVYSTMIVEKTKNDDYMGVELSTEKQLNASDAIIHVRPFHAGEISYVTEDAGFANGTGKIDSAYINKYLSSCGDEDECGEEIRDEDIVGVYDQQKDEEEEIFDTASPKITAKFSSAESLQTTLTVSATDSDNSTKELLVCLKFSKNINDSYPDPTKSGDKSKYCTGYGDNSFYSKDIDFSKPEYGGLSYAAKETIYVFITVSDPSNNITRKRMSYSVHENEKPTIGNFKIEKLDGDPQNMPTAKVTLSLSDDMDSQEDLNVCFVQDNTKATSCSNYQPYSYYFGNNGIYNYTFKGTDGQNITIPDGSKHTLKVFVKDSLELSAEETAEYTIYQNSAPFVSLGDFKKNCLFPINGSCTKDYSLTVSVNLEASDDLTPRDDLKIVFYEKNSSGEKTNIVNMTYYQYTNGNQQYTFSGWYDGKVRTLYVDVTDQYGKTATASRKLDSIYSDQAPSIVTVPGTSFITSDGFACEGDDTCYDINTYGGIYNVFLSFSVTDDLTNVNDLKVCVSETKDDCTEKNKNNSNYFVKYSDFNKKFSFSMDDSAGDLIYPTTQIHKKLYAAVVDDKGHYAAYNNLNAIPYDIYHNQAPKISGNFQITSSSEVRNLKTVKIDFSKFNVTDDFNNFDAKLCYRIDSSKEVCEDYESFNSFKEKYSAFYEFKGIDGYNGQEIKLYVKVKDNYGVEVSSKSVTYTLYKDQPPKFVSNSVKIESSETEYNSNMTFIHFGVEDFEDTYSICITSKSSCKDYIDVTEGGDPYLGTGEEYTYPYDGSSEDDWSPSYENEDSHKNLNLFVKDSHGNVISEKLSYDVYELCSVDIMKELVDDSSEYVPVSGEISAKYCEGKCFQTADTTFDPNEPGYLSLTNDKHATYKKTLSYLDKLVNLECKEDQEDELHCDYASCFDTGKADNPNVIGLKLFEPELEWTYSNSSVTIEVPVDKPYCESEFMNKEKSYFYYGDERCTRYEEEICPKATGNVCKVEVANEVAELAEQNHLIDDEYQKAVSKYEFERAQSEINYLTLKYPDYEEDIKMCVPFETKFEDDEDVTVTDDDGNPVLDEDKNPIIIQSWMSKHRDLCVGDLSDVPEEEKDACNAYLNRDKCFALDAIDGYKSDKEKFYEDYAKNHKTPEKADYIEYDEEKLLSECVARETVKCHAEYDFCKNKNIEETGVIEEVSCDENPEITPVYCDATSYLDGHCLKTEDSCRIEGCEGDNCYDDSCIKVCYVNHDCTPEVEEKPVIFNCHGYFKTYLSSKNGNEMLLHEMPLRICPDFYVNEKFYNKYYQYDSNSPTPFIQFSPREITGGDDDEG